MNLDEYVQLAAGRTASRAEQFKHRFQSDWILDLDHAARGLTTEVGELQDALKKYLIYGKQLDRINIIEELGDIMWYISLACIAIDINLSQVCELNIDKLRVRYPDKFTEENALIRDLDKERKSLEL